MTNMSVYQNKNLSFLVSRVQIGDRIEGISGPDTYTLLRILRKSNSSISASQYELKGVKCITILGKRISSDGPYPKME